MSHKTNIIMTNIKNRRDTYGINEINAPSSFYAGENPSGFNRPSNLHPLFQPHNQNNCTITI